MALGFRNSFEVVSPFLRTADRLTDINGNTMWDAIFIVLTLVVFAASIWYTRACDKV
jgi:uncharacterized membrane protein